MKDFYRLGFLLLSILPFNSCNQKQKTQISRDTIQGVWIGGAIDKDEKFYKPYPRILEFKGDTVYHKELDDNISFKQTIKFTSDSIVLDSLAIPTHKFYIDKKQLHFVNVKLNRLKEVDEYIDIVKFDTFLSSNDWKLVNKDKVYRFDHTQKEVKLIDKANATYLKFCYELVRYKNTLFLLKKGNQLACDRDYQFAEQVISYTKNNIVTFGFREGKFQNIKYVAIPKITSNLKPVNFQLCNKYINKNNPRDRYYYQGTEYNGGLYHIRKIFNEKYEVPKGNTESGIFQVRFVVNCEGKAGMYETQAFDYDYKLKSFSSEISDQIFEITKTLQDWIPGKRTRTNQIIDTYIYLNFRIKDGKIIRIYP